MRPLVRLVVRLGVGALSGALLLAWLVFQRQPLVSRAANPSPDDVRRARSLLVQNDPRRARAGTARTITLSQQDATLLSQYGASRWRTARSLVTLRERSASVQVSIPMPSSLPGSWLNVDAQLADADGVPAIHRLWIGRLPVPGFAATLLIDWLFAWLDVDAPITVARDMIRRTTFTPDSVRVSYEWRADATGRVRDMLLAPADIARLEAYHGRLAAFIATTPAGGSLTLPQLMAPLFTLAMERSASGDAGEENRAAMATLSLYVTERSLGRWIKRARTWPRAQRRRITLAGREDLAKHFMVSAVVAAEADRTLADAVGLTKEIDDSRGGSGFSFVDLAADRAGTRFGERAVSAASALQAAVAAGAPESAIMPDIARLPESMTEGEFVARFGGIGASRYQAMIDTIERRVSEVPLLR